MTTRQYGFISEPKESDFIFGGGNIPIEILQPDGDWMEYLPEKEFQAPYNFETYACVTFTILNCIETLIKKQYGITKNYSDRFLAIVSGTKSPGNSPQVVCDFLRKIGVVPQELWPYLPDMNTWDEWSAPIPQNLIDLAKEFNNEWDFRYEQVPSKPEAISEALKCSPLLISVTAWHLKDGMYYRPEGGGDNHATTMFSEREGAFRRVFDSYGSPHIKDVDWKATPEFVQRFWIKKKVLVEQQISLIKKILNLMFQLLPMLKVKEEIEKPNTIVPESLPQPEPITGPPWPVEKLTVYDWSTPEKARKSVRIICDEEKLTLEQKNTMCATVGAESGWNPKAIGKPNKDGTRDYGIVQINTRYWIGKGKQFPSTDYVLTHPAECVRWMAKLWKQGKRNYWWAYNNGSYKQYL